MATPPHLDTGETLARSSWEESGLVQAPLLRHCPVGCPLTVTPHAILYIMFHHRFVKKNNTKKSRYTWALQTSCSLCSAVVQRPPSPGGASALLPSQQSPETNGHTSQTGPLPGAGTSVHVGPESWEMPPLVQRAKPGILCVLLRLQTSPLLGVSGITH